MSKKYICFLKIKKKHLTQLKDYLGCGPATLQVVNNYDWCYVDWWPAHLTCLAGCSCGLQIIFASLQRHNTEHSKQIFPEKEYRGLSPNFHIHVSVSDLYFPRIGLPILLQYNKMCGPILGIYKSLADTWMWKLGLRRWGRAIPVLGILKCDALYGTTMFQVEVYFIWGGDDQLNRLNVWLACSLQMILAALYSRTTGNDQLTWAGRPSGCPAYRWP